MGRNKLKKWDGKTLEQWNAEINLVCKGGTERKCKQNDTIETLQFKIEMNHRCLRARAAVQHFYDEIDKVHSDEIKKVQTTLENCFRFLMQAYAHEFNLIKKAFGQYQKHQDELRAAEKAKTKSKSKPVDEMKALTGAFQSEALADLVDKKSGIISEKSLKKGESVLKKRKSELSDLNPKKIKIRKK